MHTFCNLDVGDIRVAEGMGNGVGLVLSSCMMLRKDLSFCCCSFWTTS